jgi:hypothetical protein
MISIETIGNKKVTVIRKPFDADWVKEQLSMGVPVIAQWGRVDVQLRANRNIKESDNRFYTAGSAYSSLHESELDSIVTILPALPRHPNPSDACLLYRYMAEGIRVYIREFKECDNTVELLGFEAETGYLSTSMWGLKHVEITHCTLNGERAEIAIKE